MNRNKLSLHVLARKECLNINVWNVEIVLYAVKIQNKFNRTNEKHTHQFLTQLSCIFKRAIIVHIKFMKVRMHEMSEKV